MSDVLAETKRRKHEKVGKEDYIEIYVKKNFPNMTCNVKTRNLFAIC